TTKVMVVPHQPIIREGPYRHLRHPAYLIVSLEIAVLPLIFAELRIAVVFTLANAALMAWRIKVEESVPPLAREPARLCREDAPQALS
ncbi:MAG TPA: isoprenylcysteine carboxylmethyltransferase family protein, partial [Caulobacteraceae bacterium]|nr:isoprenylcysteine carboxylmethyltransferase family protein [Caulobacteraceae bacterium]